MKKIAIASILTLFCAFMCVFDARDVSAQEGWEKTLTLPGGEVILDMSGEWDILSEFYGELSWVQPCSDLLLITQKGNTFSAVKQIGTRWLPKGTELIKGELDRDGFKAVYNYIGDIDGTYGWEKCKWEISENGNKVVLDCGERVKATLTRK